MGHVVNGMGLLGIINPIDVLDNWPSQPKGNHSKLTTQNEGMIRSLAASVKQLMVRVETLEKDNTNLKLQHSQRPTQNVQLPSSQPAPLLKSFASQVAKTGSSTNNAVVMGVYKNAKLQQIKEKRAIVVGLPITQALRMG
jgi:hypothetical protein